MGKLRSINTTIWSDVWFEQLTPTEKLLFIYLITNDHNNMLGIYELSIRKMAFETGVNSETVRKALEAFESVGKVFYKGEFVVLVNFMRHQSYNPNMKKSAINVYNALPDEIKLADLQYIDIEDYNKGFQTLMQGFGILRKIEFNLIEVEEEIERESDVAFSVPENYKNVVDVWLDYRKKIKKPIKDVSIKPMFNKLKKLSGDNPDKAMQIVNESIANGWQGLFELKQTDKPAEPKIAPMYR